MKIIIATFCALLYISGIHAQDEDNTPKYSNEFLNIGVGARALGMSNAVITSSKDVTAGYWNPTGLIGIDSDLQFGLMHSEYFAGIAKYDYGAVAKQIDSSSAMAFSIVRFGVDNIANTTELIDAQGRIDYDRITFFSAADLALMFSYARSINQNLKVGGTAKIVNRKVGDFGRSWGFGIDLAASYTKGDWEFALMARDITTTFNAWSWTLSDRTIEVLTETNNEIPQNGLEITLPRFILGASRTWDLNNGFTLLSEINADITTDGHRNTLFTGNPFSMDPYMGLELGIKDIVFVRSGLGNIQRATQLNGKEGLNIQPNIGLGVKIQGFTIDYALTALGKNTVALYSNVFSLKFNLNGPTK